MRKVISSAIALCAPVVIIAAAVSIPLMERSVFLSVQEIRQQELDDQSDADHYRKIDQEHSEIVKRAIEFRSGKNSVAASGK